MPIVAPKYKLSHALVDAAPDEQGVYALWEDEELIYLGRASQVATIKACLKKHFTRGICACVEKATHYSWELSLRPATRELEFLQEFLARFGRIPRCNEDRA